MSNEQRNSINPWSYYGLGELHRRIKQDFKNPAVQAEFLKWKAEREARIAQGLPADEPLANNGANNNMVFQPDGTVVVCHTAKELGAVEK